MKLGIVGACYVSWLLPANPGISQLTYYYYYYYCQILVTFGCYRQIFEKYSYMNYYNNTSSGTRAVSCVRKDRYD
jgi:hypothetical protein